MSIITKVLKQTCVYWALTPEEGTDVSYDDYGQPIVTASDPVEISCRWEDKNEEFISANGTKMVSRAVVYVGQDVAVGGILMLGTKDNITDSVTIKNNAGAYEIKAFSKLPNFKATEFLRTAYL